MTIQEQQDSTFQKVTNFGREFVAQMWETLRGIFRDLIPPRAWLRAFIIAYLGVRLVFFLIDDPGQVMEMYADNSAPQAAPTVNQGPPIPSEMVAKVASHKEPLPIESQKELTGGTAETTNSSRAIWRISLIVMLVLLVIEFLVNGLAMLVAEGVRSNIQIELGD